MQMTKHTIHLLGYASGLGGVHLDCGQGPLVLQESRAFKRLVAELSEKGLALHWDALLQPQSCANPEARQTEIQRLCQTLALQIAELKRKKEFFMVFGGDHTSAIGTWTGVYEALSGPLGLIWVDAHMDSHTPATTESGRTHGMPLASLLGYGDPRFTQLLSPSPKIDPANLCLIGVRSYEAGEEKLLKELGVRLYFMEEVKKRGLAVIFQEALTRVTQGTLGFGLSLDLDSLDPQDAPGVDVPEPDGLRLDELAEALKPVMRDPRLQGIEVAEFDPRQDHEQRTLLAIVKLIEAMVG